MKNLAIVITSICILLFCTSCAKEVEKIDDVTFSKEDSKEETQPQTITEPELYSEYPEYFRQILLEQDGLAEPIAKYGDDCYYELISAEDNIIELDYISIGLEKVIHDLVIDLSEYNNDLSNGFSIFYSKEIETFYLMDTELENTDYFYG